MIELPDLGGGRTIKFKATIDGVNFRRTWHQDIQAVLDGREPYDSLKGVGKVLMELMNIVEQYLITGKLPETRRQ
jgi:hypothetical protein